MRTSLQDSIMTESRPKASRNAIILLLLLALAAGLRFYHLGFKSLWGDEIWTASWSRPGLAAIAHTLTRPPDMPIIYMLVHLSTRIGGETEFWVRFPSALFGVVAVYYLYKLANLWLENRVAMIAAFLLAISPLLIWYAQDARYYALLSALTVGTVYYFYRALAAPKVSFRYGAIFILFSVLSIYTHLFSGWYLLALGMFALILLARRWRERNQASDSWRDTVFLLLVSGGVILLLSLPVVRLTFSVLHSGVGPTGEALARFSLRPARPFFFTAEFLQQIINLFSGGNVLQWILPPLFLAGWVRLYKAKKDAVWLLALLIAVPIVTSLFIDFLHNVTVKYFVYLLPFFLLLAAAGLDAAAAWLTSLVSGKIDKRTGVWGRLDVLILAISLLLLSWLHVAPLQMLYRQVKQNDWRAVARFVESQAKSGDVVLTERWGKAATEYYLPQHEDAELIPLRGQDWRQLADAASGAVWAIGLKGQAEREMAAGYPPVDLSPWRDPSIIYQMPNDAVIFFPVTEVEATIYKLKERIVPSRVDFSVVKDAGWTKESYTEIPPQQQKRVLLSLPAQQERLLRLNYLDQSGRDIEMLVDEQIIGRITGGVNGKGWQTAIWPLPANAPETITVTLRAVGEGNAVVNWIDLTAKAQKEQAAQTPKGEKPNASSPPHSVWIVGDSLTRGLFASAESATYRNRLFASLQAYYPGQIHATFWEGVCTLAGLEQQWGDWIGRPDIMFIELGINDLGGNRHCPRIPDEAWRARYGAMLDRILQEAPGVRLVVGTVPWSGWSPESAEYEKAEQFNAWIREEADKRGLPVADLWSATVGRRDGLSTPEQPSVFPPYFHGDNFHPNDLGHRRIADAFFDAYRKAWPQPEAQQKSSD